MDDAPLLRRPLIKRNVYHMINLLMFKKKYKYRIYVEETGISDIIRSYLKIQL